MDATTKAILYMLAGVGALFLCVIALDAYKSHLISQHADPIADSCAIRR